MKNKIIKKIKQGIFGLLMAAVFIFIVSNDYKASQYTMVKGDRTIVFQGMLHFAEKSFYDEINAEIKHYKNIGYSHYYEIIKIEKERLPELTNFMKLPDIPADKMGLTSQHNNLTIEDDDFNADVSGEELLELRAPANLITSENVYNYAFPRAMVFGIKSSLIIEESLLFVSDIFSVERPWYLKNVFTTFYLGKEKTHYLNDVRNDNLIKHIENTDKNLFITYGEAHFLDFREKMEKKGWKIIKEKKILAINNLK